MNRRDFLAASALMPCAVASATEPLLETAPALNDTDRKETLIHQGRLKAIRYPWKYAICKTGEPEFPTGVPIRNIAGFSRLLPLDAIQIEPPRVDLYYCAWIGIFAHESFAVASPYEHIPVCTYVENHQAVSA